MPGFTLEWPVEAADVRMIWTVAYGIEILKLCDDRCKFLIQIELDSA
jgi:hypothetical protein